MQHFSKNKHVLEDYDLIVELRRWRHWTKNNTRRRNGMQQSEQMEILVKELRLSTWCADGKRKFDT